MVNLATFLIIPRRDPEKKEKLIKTKGGICMHFFFQLIFPSGYANHTSGFLSMKRTENAPKCT